MNLLQKYPLFKMIFKGWIVLTLFFSIGCQGLIRPGAFHKRAVHKKKVPSRNLTVHKTPSKKKSLKKLTLKKRAKPSASRYEMLLAEVKKWDHTRYKWGGTTSKGIDCSAFVMVVFKNLYNIKLPRTTKSQLQTGTLISKHQLDSGDLVFFQIYHSRRHVGIFLKNGQFAHVSSKKGVRISNINDDYWRHRFLAARRVL